MALCRCPSSNPVFLLIAVAAVSASALSNIWSNDKSAEQGPETAPVTTEPAEPPRPELADPAFALGFEMPKIDGAEQDLFDYKGRVVLMVNVASKCGLTPQYEALEKLYREHKDDGLVILGFPANDFGAQEPGTNEEIFEFCSDRFDVTFPMFGKISVVGDTAHPLYERLREQQIEEVGGQEGVLGGDPKWNFTKFLLDRTGRVDSRYSPRVKPDDDRLTKRIGELLASEG